MKKFLVFCIIGALVLTVAANVGFKKLHTEQRKHQLKGIVLSIPSHSEMNQKEIEDDSFLFDGDTLVRIHVKNELLGTDTVITAVNIVGTPLPSVGDSILISNFWNGDEYLVLK